MTNIDTPKMLKAHILNFHYISTSHIEVMLEDTSTTPSRFYQINRWSRSPQEKFVQEDPETHGWTSFINSAGSIFTIEIDAEPDEVVAEWLKYKKENKGNIFTKNCGDATQWFLQRFANITPYDNERSFKMNYLCCGLFVPSFLPCITLPGRVMDNVKAKYEAEPTTSSPRMFSKCKRNGLVATLAVSIGATTLLAYQQYGSK